MKEFFNFIGETFSEGREKVITEFGKYKNETFLEALIASTVFISMSDGHITEEEKKKLFSYIQQEEGLKLFSSDEIIAVFKKITEYYDFDRGIGNAECLKIIAKMKQKTDQSLFMLRVAMVFVKGDGELKEHEKKALETLCTELAVPLEKVLGL